MAGKKSRLVRLVVVAGSAFAKHAFYTADIGHQLIRFQDWGELVQPFENAEYGAAKQDQVTLFGCGQRFFGNNVNCPTAQSHRSLNRVAVPSEDRSAEAALSQRHSHRAADQPGAKNGDALNRHS